MKNHDFNDDFSNDFNPKDGWILLVLIIGAIILICLAVRAIMAAVNIGK
jgi:hypothetical protein